MGTRSVIAVEHGDGWRGRYCHWDGYPTGVGEALRQIVKRDGLDTAIRTLTQDYYGWSNVNAQDQQELHKGYQDGRFAAVPGYGIAYTTHQGQSRPEQWHTSDDRESWCEWAYVLTATGIDVYTLPFESAPVLVGTVAYDDANGMSRAEESVYALDGA